jgi:hypothetical protein
MSIVRLVIAWLVMAALPLQGLAAGSMLFCDQASHSTAAPGERHDHAAHEHAPGAQAAHEHAIHADDMASRLSQQDDGAQADHAQAQSGHACPICASCCNLVALSETPTLSVGGASPMAPPLQGPARVVTRVAPAPDKPPRA